jgi:hypothetical protein
MTSEEALLEKIKVSPPDLKPEVAHFVKFLQTEICKLSDKYLVKLSSKCRTELLPPRLYILIFAGTKDHNIQPLQNIQTILVVKLCQSKIIPRRTSHRPRGSQTHRKC